MGNNETEATSKPAKVSSQQDQVAVHSYPDWSAMQAYYGPGVGIPAPYFAAAVVPGHAPHPYMWGPQPMMPPFGTPYPAIYAHSGYPHPPLTLSPHVRSQGHTSSATSEAATVTPGTEIHDKPKDSGLLKKLKGFDGLAVSTSNGDGDNKGGWDNGQSQSEEDCGGSSDGSEDISQGSPTLRKRGPSTDVPSKGKKVKGGTKSSTEDVSPTMSPGIAMGNPTIVRKAVGAPPLGNPGMDLGVSVVAKQETAGAPPISNTATLPMREPWIQDEHELKRERRKQSNRESARRSRLRKQAETEELAMKVEALSTEKATLESEISRLSEMSEKLRQENSSLMEKLKILEGGEPTVTPGKVDSKKISPISFENLLSRLDNSNSSNMDGQQELDSRDSSNLKLHQLLEPKS